MTVPTAITDLSTTAASNDPQGSESVFPSLDDYLRAAYKFIADLYTGSVSLVQVSVTGSATFNGATTVTKAAAATNLDVTAASTYAANLRLAGNATTAGTTSLDLYQTTGSAGYLLNRANAALGIGTNNTTRITVAATGGVTIAAPSSGTPLQVTGPSSITLDVVSEDAAGGYMRVRRSSTTDMSFLGNAGTLVTGGSNGETALRGEGAVAIASGGANRRVTVASAGNVTINAPSSGNGLTITQAPGASLVLGDQTTDAKTSMLASGFTVSLGNLWNSGRSEIGTALDMNIGTTAAKTVTLKTNNSDRVAVNSTGNVTINAPDSGYGLNIPTGTPATAGATGTAGDICWDSSYIYVCTATNTWKRAAIATW